MAKELKTIGVLTSGGDAPGMNAAIRAVAKIPRHTSQNAIIEGLNAFWLGT